MNLIPVKALACLIVFVLVIAGGWYFAHNDQMATISDLENKEQALRNEFTTKAREAANLNDYKDQIAELESLPSTRRGCFGYSGSAPLVG